MGQPAEGQLFSVALTNANTTLFAAPTTPSGYAKIECLTIANTDSASRTFRLSICPSGASAAVQYAKYWDVAIPANSTWNVTMAPSGWYIPTGGTVQGLASVTSVVTVSADGYKRQ